MRAIRGLLAATAASLILASTAHATPAPSTIDPTCSSDVTAELDAFVESVGDGGTADLPVGACYRVDGTLEWSLNSLTLNGNGTTIRAETAGSGTRAHIRLVNGGGWTIRDLHIEGANPYGAVHTYDMQWQHGIDMRGVQGALIERVDVVDPYGDSYYVGKSDQAPSRDVRIIDSSGQRTGRVAGVAVVSGERITVSGGYYALAGLNVFDIEPNNGNLIDGVLIEGVEVGPWPQRQWNVAITGPPSGSSATVRNITVRGNHFTGSPMTIRSDLAGDKLRVGGVRVEDNTSTVTYEGPLAAVVAHHTDGLTVTGNHQPLAGQYLVYACDSTAVSVSGNTFPGGIGELSTAKKKRC